MKYQSLEECTSRRQTATEWDSPWDRPTNHNSASASRRGGVDIARKSYDREQRSFSQSSVEDSLPEVGWTDALEFFVEKVEETKSSTSLVWQELGRAEDVTEVIARESGLRKAAAAFQSSSLFSTAA
eukprot:CAMPEP_0198197978 /NCGR_PEP_ID=MMETSP1445-20131203/1519_1 /TAXON_ID=36898 /ORGANISM="Pyramimonas sp., Strain CCMP2087" /LENGTH=126 /DNA_ID=CAMNT_0043867403 /DNA_START=133 /DNA_END=513 /DNA_ORIENTATION=-